MDELDTLKELVASRRARLGATPATSKPEFDGINFHPDEIYGDNYIRGRKNVMSYDEMRGFARGRLKPDDYGVFWGGVYISTSEATNFCIVGIPGSGKTTLIRLLMQSVLPLIGLKDKSKAHARRIDRRYYADKYGVPDPGAYPPKTDENYRALIFDVKPEYLSYLSGMNLNCKVKILDPYHVDGCIWDTGKDIDDSRVRTFAKTFIPEAASGGENSRFFLDSARDVVANALTALNRSRPGNWTVCDFIDLMRNEDACLELLRSYPDLRASLRQIQARGETFQNVVQQIRTFVADIEPASNAWRRAGSKVSLKDWLDNEYILVLARKEEYRESVDPIYRVMFGIAASLALSYDDSTTRNTWFFLDELGNAGELTNLAELMSMGRSKGCKVVIGAQGIPTLQRVFRSKEKVNEITELCAYTAILRTGDSGEGGTASWAEKLLGKCEFYETKTGASLAKAYTTGTTTTKTDGTSRTTSDSQASGTSSTTSKSNTSGESTTRGSQNGSSYTHTKSSSTGYYPTTGESNAYGNNESSSSARTTTDSFTNGSTDGTTRTTTTGSSLGENASTAEAVTESEARTSTLTINRDRLEKSLVLASQISSLKTLKYDGVLVGYFITPFSTYSLALPSEYITRAVQRAANASTVYQAASSRNASVPTPQDHEELLAQRLAMSGKAVIRDLRTE